MSQANLNTPMMRQYWEIKGAHQDAILLFRMGDFYEMFFDDAKVAAKDLEIALTSRDKNSENPIPLCGVPHHSVSGYISQLLDKGHKVAICEQVEDPKQAQGIVRREVVRVITPGLRTDVEGLPAKELNPLVSLCAGRTTYGLAWVDVSNGYFAVTEFNSLGEAVEEIQRLGPRELLLPEGKPQEVMEPHLGPIRSGLKSLSITSLPDWVYDRPETKLCERFAVATLDGFGLESITAGIAAAAAILHYVETENRTSLPHLVPPKFYGVQDYLHMDLATRQNLELFRSHGEPGREGSLFYVLDETRTSMGARRLRQWLHFPLRSREKISQRLDAVEELVRDGELREKLRTPLAQVYDLERLIGRIASARANAKDLVALGQTLAEVEPLKEELAPAQANLLQHLRNQMHSHTGLVTFLQESLGDNPPPTLKEGGFIKAGFDRTLDDLRSLVTGGRQWLAEMEAEERKNTGISSLKVRYNKVFGYYIEITKSNLNRAPAHYERKQTLANSERFITPALKEQEAKILGAEEKIAALEYELFEKIREEVSQHTRSIQEVAHHLADLDVLCSLSRVAVQNQYTRPNITDDEETVIVAGRHPVVEKFLTEHPFVPNDIVLNCQERQLIILTGPNMAGKSTIMRQVALITLLAQMGSFVPAEKATLGLADRIFTRVGASDDLVRGRSTFMVEMSETANILRHATRRSLILLDEIGRGTSTFDGLSIAWAVAEDIHDRVGARTIFATHYHELTDLARTKDRVRNMNVAVKEWGEKIVFLRTLAEGAVNRSYGIEVARLAGVPTPVIGRARKILANLEAGELDATGKPVLAQAETPLSQEPHGGVEGVAPTDLPMKGATLAPKIDQLELFRRMADELLESLRKSDPDALTPKEASDLLYAWRNRFV